MSISESRKSRVESPTIVSKSRQTRRRPVGAALLHRDSVRVNATELARRQILRLTAGAAALPAASRMLWAQAYPARPVRMVVGFAAGGTADFAARLISQWLSERLGQQFVIENRPGAGGNIAAEAVVRAPADGYTLLALGINNAFNMWLYDKLSFNFLRDIAPVTGINSGPAVLVVHPSLPPPSVPEFIAYVKANPGKFTVASGGHGSFSHLCSEMFKAMTGINLVHVPYRGAGQAISDLIGGQVQAMFNGMSGTVEHIRAGKLRPLALTTSARSEALPGIPTIGEFVPGYEASGWNGIGVARNTPVEIVEKLNNEINAALADRNLKTRLADVGSVPIPMTTAEFGKFIADETEKWGKVIRAANIKL